MKQQQNFSVINHTIAGFTLGFVMIFTGMLLNYYNGFKGPWFHIFDYSPDFVIVVFSPIYLSLVFSLIGFRREQLLQVTRQIEHSLSKEQVNNSVADQRIKLLAKIVEQVNEAIVISDGHGLVQYVNDGFTKINGYSFDDVKGKNVGSVLHGPLTDHTVAKNMVQRAVTGEAVMEELLVYHKNGSTHWLSISIKPICSNTGEITHFIAIQNDITSRKEKAFAIETLYKQVADYKFALDQAAIVIIFNNDGKIIHVNRKFCEINDLPEHELIGADYRSISISMRDKNFVKPVWDILTAGRTWKGELVNRNRNGELYWAETTIVPLLDAAGKPNQFLAIQNDITSRKLLEGQLIANKNKLQQAMHIARIGSWEKDLDGTYLISEELRQLLNVPGGGDVVKDIFANILPDDMELVKEGMGHTFKTLQRVEVEYRYLINGNIHYMLSIGNPRLDEHGKLLGSFGTVQDITTAKMAALALKKSEEEKTVIINNTQTIICLHDMAGVLIDINPAAEKMSGFKKEEVKGMNLRMIISPENQDEFDKYITTINSNDTASGTLQIFTKTGQKRVWLYHNTAYANEGGKPYVIASAIDITESVKSQNELERQQQFTRQIIDNSPNVIFVMNDQQQVILANKIFSKYYPCQEKTAIQAKVLSHGPDDIFLGDVDGLLDMEEGEIVRIEGSLTNPETDSPSWFNIINKCFKEKSGKKYILGFGMDITNRHQIETDLIAANEMVERSLKVKDQFISNMSHEIRTPLNAVIGFTDLLSETTLDTTQKEYVDIVQTASANLLALINNILDLSKIESGNMALENLPVDVRKIIYDVVKILEPKAKAKGLQITTVIEGSIPEKVMGDQLRLTQVLFNLLGNAVKFTDAGSVDICCKLVNGTDKRKDYFSFSVADTGIGVEEEKQADIFDRFTQANTNTQRLYGGTGLGLNITKSIVDLYGGTLTMESAPGKGTVFQFILPFKKYLLGDVQTTMKTENPESNDMAGNASPVHILLAEDNRINAMLATQVLSKKGFTLVHVLNGELAVEAIQKEHFDVILMDIQMPVMNGINATKIIRKMEGEVATIPIIAMTAHSMHGEMQNCYASGMNGYVAKPFKAADLFNTINEVVKKHAANASDNMN